jgi:abortive infection bacteriophage resistance protein
MKSFKIYDEQLDILEAKGLKINNRTFAKRILKKEDYYNLQDLFIHVIGGRPNEQ